MHRKARIALPLAIPLLTATLLAGCGGGVRPSPQVSVQGAFGKTPAVQIPKAAPGNKLLIRTLVTGKGAQLGRTDSFVGNFVAYDWSGTKHTELASTFSHGQPTLFTGRLLPGLEMALRGKKMGSRVLAVIPPAEGYGSHGNAQGNVKPNDTLVFVIDMIRDYAPGSSAGGGQHVSNGGAGLPTVGNAAAGSAPPVTIPRTAPPRSLVVRTLIRGTGPAVRKGDYVIAQYVGENWQPRKVFDSSWTRGQPLGAVLGAQPSQLIPGWDKGLIGQHIGSRVLLVIPPADGYGNSGNAQAGIKGTDTLVFVVDLLGAYGPASA